MLVIVAMLGAGIVQAQQQPQPSPKTPIPPPGSQAPPPEVPKEKQIEGTVSKVDPVAKTVGVSTGLWGLLGATVQVVEETQIMVQGQPSALTGIKEGDRVKASYEVRDGNNLAKSIEVMPAPKKAPGTTP